MRKSNSSLLGKYSDGSYKRKGKGGKDSDADMKELAALEDKEKSKL